MIYSNEWRAYSFLSTLGYTHTLNHSPNFVGLRTGAHIQTVEWLWGSRKSMMRQQKSMHSCLFETYKSMCGESTIGQNASWNIYPDIIFAINPQRTCTARVMVVAVCLCWRFMRKVNVCLTQPLGLCVVHGIRPLCMLVYFLFIVQLNWPGEYWCEMYAYCRSS